MSSERFVNKCEACKYYDGIKYPGHAWGPDIYVDCSLGIQSFIGRGCSNFEPIRLGCSADCYLHKGKDFPDCGYINANIIRGDAPCYNYAKSDWTEPETKKKDGCFISTAVCQSQNLPDDCDELTTLRYFRDNQLLNDEKTAHLVYEYYEKSPKLIHKLDNNNDLNLYLYNNFIVNLVQMIKNKDEKQVIVKKYQEMFNYLESF